MTSLEKYLDMQIDLATPEFKIQQKFYHLIEEGQQIQSSDYNEIMQCLIQKGYITAASEVYDNYFVVNSISVNNSIIEELEKYKNKIVAFNEQIIHSGQSQIMQPVLKWAQNKESVFLMIKFAHRIDSPGYANVNINKLEFKPYDMLLLANGTQGNSPLQFLLNLTLYQKIIPKLSSWKQDSVGILIEYDLLIQKGTLFVNMTKSNENKGTIWRRLCQDRMQKYPIWQEMKNIYKNEMGIYERLAEEEEIEREKIQKQIDKQKKDQEIKEKQLQKEKETRFYDS